MFFFPPGEVSNSFSRQLKVIKNTTNCLAKITFEKTVTFFVFFYYFWLPGIKSVWIDWIEKNEDMAL